MAPSLPPSFTLEDEQHRVFEGLLQVFQKSSGFNAIEDAMVSGQGDTHGLGDSKLAVARDGAVLDRPDRQDRRLWGNDDRAELVDVEHPHVRYREGSPGERIAAEASGLRLLDEIGGPARNPLERQMLAAAQHRSDQAILDCDGYADVDILMIRDTAVRPRSIDAWMALQRERPRTDDHVREGDAFGHGAALGYGLAHPRCVGHIDFG